jgi:hypothetical protein
MPCGKGGIKCGGLIPAAKQTPEQRWAVEQGLQLRKASMKDYMERAVRLYMDNNGELQTTEVVTGNETSVSHPALPPGAKPRVDLHTHPPDRLKGAHPDAEEFSRSDLWRPPAPQAIATPLGAIRWYDPKARTIFELRKAEPQATLPTRRIATPDSIRMNSP